MTKRQAKKWANALRSGNYNKGIGVLQTKTKTRYCCLGVACRVFGNIEERRLQGGSLSSYPQMQDFLGIGSLGLVEKIPDPDFNSFKTITLADLNDDGVEGLSRFNFDEIADIIELKWVHDAF